MTHDLDKLAYMNGAPVERQYIFPYNECYFGDRMSIECLHEWKQKQIERFETFRRKVFGLEIPTHASDGQEIRCEIPKHMEFFMEHRLFIKAKLSAYGVYAEITSSNITDAKGEKWTVETIGVAGHWRLWAKLKHEK